MSEWRIEYGNDVGPNDDGFWEWWDVTDGHASVRCDSKADAIAICSRMNETNDEEKPTKVELLQTIRVMLGEMYRGSVGWDTAVYNAEAVLKKAGVYKKWFPGEGDD